MKTESVDIPSVVNFSPDIVPTIETISFCGGGNHSFVLTSNGKVYGAGLNTAGQLCSSNDAEVSFTFIDKLSSKFISSIACGWDFSIFLNKEGDLYGSGSNKFGQLSCSSEPSQVFPIERSSIHSDYMLFMFLEFIGTFSIIFQ